MRLIMAAKKRITIMMDERLDKRLRTRQSKQIMDSQGSVSYSKIVNQDLAKFYKLTNFEY